MDNFRISIDHRLYRNKLCINCPRSSIMETRPDWCTFVYQGREKRIFFPRSWDCDVICLTRTGLNNMRDVRFNRSNELLETRILFYSKRETWKWYTSMALRLFTRRWRYIDKALIKVQRIDAASAPASL